MRVRWLLAFTVVLGISGAASAQPANAPEPTFELRVRSINDLITKGEYIAGLTGDPANIQNFRNFIGQIPRMGNGLVGIDVRKPFGAYASLSLDVINSPVTIMIPIADKAEFVKLLTEKANLTLEKAENDTQVTVLPFDQEGKYPLYLKFANDYLYVGRSPKDLDNKVLIAPKDFFAKDDGAVASFLFRVDRVPGLMRKGLIARIDELSSEVRKKIDQQEKESQKVAIDWLQEGLVGGMKTLVEDSKEVNIKIFIDDKTDFMSAELNLIPKPGTTLAKNITSLGQKTSRAAAIVAVKDPVGRFSMNFAMTDELAKKFGPVWDNLTAELVKDAPPQEKALAKLAVDAFGPTAKAAVSDIAVTLAGPDAKGRNTLLAAVAVKQGKGIDKAMKDLVRTQADLKKAADFAFDVQKVGDFTIHKITIKEFPPELEKFFGTKTMWLAISDDIIAASIEQDGTALRAGLNANASPIPVPAAVVEASLTKLAPLFDQKVNPAQLQAQIAKVFGTAGPVGRDTVTFSVTGGDKLTVKARVEGKGIRVMTGLDPFKIK